MADVQPEKEIYPQEVVVSDSRRPSISKKIRFEVFKRDGFKCAYCGKTPPGIVLEIDHIDPKAGGGGDDPNNLITSCFDCNRGKRDIPLTRITPKLQDNLEVLKEQEEQLKEYRNFIKRIQKRERADVNEIDHIYSEQYPGWGLSDTFRDVSLKKFLRDLPKHEVIDSLLVSISKFPTDRDRVINYFCGVCWNKIRSYTDPNYQVKKQLIGVWQNMPRGSGYLAKGILDFWLSKYTKDQIAEAMFKAKGIWADLKIILGGLDAKN